LSDLPAAIVFGRFQDNSWLSSNYYLPGFATQEQLIDVFVIVGYLSGMN
jgi:hypothetical protein